MCCVCVVLLLFYFCELYWSMCVRSCVVIFFFFFKQKTAYEMRISDWSSDVCSSDLQPEHPLAVGRYHPRGACRAEESEAEAPLVHRLLRIRQVDHFQSCRKEDRKSTRLNSSH